MAPSTTASPVQGSLIGRGKDLLGPTDFNRKIEEEGSELFPKSNYTHYLPTWNPNEKYPPLKPFSHHEHGIGADPTFPDLLRDGVKIQNLTPSIGSEIFGVQLSSLSSVGKDQLALLVAQRKVIAFRGQEFADLPIEAATEFCRYFGRLNIHPMSGSPIGHPEVHLAHRGAGDRTVEAMFSQRVNSTVWHADATYELQPPGTSFLYMLEQPVTGGDTLFSDQVEAYSRLSPEFRKRLHGLKAVHSDVEKAEATRQRGGIVKREPVSNVHPIVRTHPATGERSLFINQHYVTHIVGLKKEESDYLLGFLYEHIRGGADFHLRMKWAEKTVVVFDNRVTCHTALFDWVDRHRRHLARISPEAERPVEAFQGELNHDRSPEYGKH